MAPSLESPMTQSSIARSERPRRLLPIIPAIPRSLEGKLKQEKAPQNLDEEVKVKEERPVPAEIQQPQEEATPLSAPESQNSDADGSSSQEILEKDVEHAVEEEHEVFTVQSPSTVQDFGIEKHGFKLPPPFYPRRSSAVVMSNHLPASDPTSHDADTSLQEHTAQSEDTAIPQDPSIKLHPLRAEASTFHANPAPPADLAIFPIKSPTNRFASVQTYSSDPQPTPSTNATSSLTHQTGQGYGHAHNISFFHAPPMSSNDPSSPAHSIYQGYAYAPPPYGYSTHAHSASQHSTSYHPYAEGYASPRQPYGSQSPFQNSNPPFSTLGSQSPLTPSATPLEALHRWKMPNGPAAMHPEYDSNSIFQHPEYFRSKRSTSHNSLESNHRSARLFEAAGVDDELEQYNLNGSDDRRTLELNVKPGTQMSGDVDGAPLAEHLLRHFNDPEYADCRLSMSHSNKRFARTEWDLSKLLLVQSRKLRDLLKTAEEGEDGKLVVTFNLTDRFVTPTSMESALRVLYGMPPEAFVVSEHENEATAKPSTRRMKKSLAYAATGCLLHLKDVVLRGLMLASQVLDWENLESALSFGLESRLEREFNASSAVIPAYSTLLARESDPSPSSHVLFTPESSDTPAAQQSSSSSRSASSPESYHRPPPQSAHDLLMHCLDFMIANFPTSWELDLSARPLADVDRLPTTAESRSPLSKSRLSHIQFGSHPSEATAKSADRNVLISTVLFSIPFLWLQHLLHEVGEPISQFIGPIIKERERRRNIVLQSKSVPWADRIAAKDYAWADAGYEEFVETNADGKPSISRRYTGIALDTNDENVNER